MSKNNPQPTQTPTGPANAPTKPTRNTAATAEQIAQAVVEAIREKKGHNIAVMDLRALENTIADFFIVCSGRSDTQNVAIADEVDKHLRDTLNERPRHIEGRQLGEWILLDYIDVVVHVFLPRVRDYFGIEELWGDANITRYEE